MKDISGTNGDQRQGRMPRIGCFMAYTINNTQPVICTLVSDQPYFYMEDECSSEESELSGIDLPPGFEEEMAEIRKKLDALDSISSAELRDPAALIGSVISQGFEMTAQTPPRSLAMEDLLDVLSKSRTAQTMIDFAKSMNVCIKESDQTFCAEYDKAGAKILVSPALSELDQVILCTRELRRHWQHRKGVLLNPASFDPDQAVLINRALEADLCAFMVRVCWELQLSGRRDIWDHIEQSSLSDVARTFAREAFFDFRSLANGQAASAAFERWFLSEHCRLQDKKIIHKMLAEHQGYSFQNESASRSVSRDLLLSLGEQPSGQNYLAPHIRRILEDPVFMEVRDRSNANFLWFIKFERAVHDTEQAMQNPSDEVVSTVSSTSSTRAKGSIKTESDTVITLSARGIVPRGMSDRNGSLESDFDTANVILAPFGNNGTV